VLFVSLSEIYNMPSIGKGRGKCPRLSRSFCFGIVYVAVQFINIALK